MKLNVVIPAAGASGRMGVTKALLQVGDKSVIDYQIDTLHEAGLYHIFVVANEESLIQKLQSHKVEILSPANPPAAMLESIRYAITQFTGQPDGMMVVPSDFPYLTKSLLNHLKSHFKSNPEKITVPSHRGKRGHPIIIPAKFLDEVKNDFDNTGIRGLYDAFPEDINKVEWKDDCVLKNMNTPEDYHAFLNWYNKQNR